jgi:chromosome segregation ATPase
LSAVAGSSVELRRSDALLSAERDRCRLLEIQAVAADTARQELLCRIDVLDTDHRAAVSEASEKARAAAQADAQLRTVKGRMKVLEAQLEEAAAAEADAQRRARQIEGERGAATSVAAKEAASLSFALRTARSRFGPDMSYLLCHLR